MTDVLPVFCTAFTIVLAVCVCVCVSNTRVGLLGRNIYVQHIRMYNKKYVLIPEVNILGRKNTKRTQRRGRNVCAGWAN